MMQYQKGNTSIIVSFIIVIGIVGLIVYALMHKSAGTVAENQAMQQDQSTTPSTPTTNSNNSNQDGAPGKSTSSKPMDTKLRALADFTPIAHVETLQKIDTVVGTGREVKPGDTVSVHYTGAVAATAGIFQSSKDFGTDPVTFPLGQVIKGWTDGIPGMKVGGTRRLIIPAAQAYGAHPPAGSGIPANADLVFDVELIAIQ